MSEDPWKDIPSPSASQSVNAKRVDADLQWDFFWAKDVNSHCLLMLTFDKGSQPQGHLPNPKGIDLSTALTPDGNRVMLLFCLMDSSQKDIFRKLCLDIVASSVAATDEKEAVSLAVRRTWRWHHLLRGGADGRLSPEEQKAIAGLAAAGIVRGGTNREFYPNRVLTQGQEQQFVGRAEAALRLH